MVQNWHHPALSESTKIWSLSSVPQVRKFTYAIDDVAKRQLVLSVFDEFERHVLPIADQFTAGVFD